MKIRGRFEKQRLQVGLSSEFALGPFRDPERKYQVADWLGERSGGHIAHFTYEKTTFDFELATSAGTIDAPARLRCLMLINALPDGALSEAEEELAAIGNHYLALSRPAEPARLPAAKFVNATVIERVKT